MDPHGLLSLPDELMLHAATLLLTDSLPSALRLCGANSALWSRLEPVRVAAAARRLQWVILSCPGILSSSGSSSPACSLSNCERTFTFNRGPVIGPWTAGRLLPTSGTSSWRVRVDCQSTAGGGLCIGVCDEECRHHWSMYQLVDRPYCSLSTGMLQHGSQGIWAYPHDRVENSMPVGYPGPAPSNRRIRPAPRYRDVVDVSMNHDTGELAFGVNGGPRQIAYRGFPPGAAVRPWGAVWARDTGCFTLLGVLERFECHHVPAAAPDPRDS